MWKSLLTTLMFCVGLVMSSLQASNDSIETIGIDQVNPLVKVWFVNNTNPDVGDGSLQSPFNTLLAAQNASGQGDIIYVFAGDGTSQGMNQGFVMQDGQQIIGSGVSFRIQTAQGPKRISAQTAEFPLITNTNGNGIELANDVSVKGLHIDAASEWAIHAVGLSGLSVRDNLITNPDKFGGVGIFNCNNELDIKKNKIFGTNCITNIGIDIENSGSLSLLANVKNNEVANFYQGIVAFTFDNCVAISFIENNNVSKTFTAINAQAFNQSDHNISIGNNMIFDNQGNGIVAISNLSSKLATAITKNNVMNSGLEGIVASTISGAFLRASIQGNTVTGSGGQAGIFVETSLSENPGDNVCLSLVNNQSDNGYLLQNFNFDTFNLEPLDGNVGIVMSTGTITNVPVNFCDKGSDSCSSSCKCSCPDDSSK